VTVGGTGVGGSGSERVVHGARAFNQRSN
jgi:hypothetical protein